MLRRSLSFAVVFIVAACRPLELPDPPVDRAGTFQGTVRYTQPGRSAELPAQAATVQLLNSSAVTSTRENGFFSLSPITKASGEVLISFTVPDAGTTLKKLLRLQDFKAGPNRDVNVGPVLLGGNAALRGKVELSDQPNASRGLGGTTVFVPEGPFLTYTGDDGSFLMNDLPEGPLTLAFFRPGYGATSAQVLLVANQLFSMSTTTLDPAPASAPSSKVSGKVQLAGQTDHSGITVSVSGSTETAVTNADGVFEFAALAPGLRTFGFQKPGFRSVTQYNVLVLGSTLELTLVTLVEGDSTPPDLDAGAPYDGGFGPLPDGGMRPVAIARPLKPFFTDVDSIEVDGSGSLGVRPLRYRWEEVSTPTRLTGLPREGYDQATLRTPAPMAFIGAVTIRLTVTDATGAESLPVEVPVIVAQGKPTVFIEPPMVSSFYPGWRVRVNAAATDTNNVGIDRFDWSVSPADSGVTLQPQDGGVLVVMPAVVTASQPFTLGVQVTDGLGVVSDPAQASFALVPGSSSSWTLSPSPFVVVDANQVVTLTPAVSGANDPNLLTWQWSWTGIDAGFTLINDTTPQPQFAAPVISGPDQTITFRAVVTDPTGVLSPASQTTFSFVQVHDSTLPQVARTSVVNDAVLGPRGNPFGAWVEYDEAIQDDPFASLYVQEQLNNVIFFPPGTRAAVLEGRQVRVAFNGFAEEGAAVTLTTGGFKDLATPRNTASSQSVSYLVTWAWPSPAVGVDTTTPSAPAVLLTSRPLGAAAAHLVTREDGRVGFYQPLVLPCDGGCAVSADLTPPQVALASGGSRAGPRGFVAGGIPYAAMQTDDGANPGVVVARLPDAGWTSVGPVAGTLFGGPNTAYATSALAGELRISTFDPATRTWQSRVALTGSQFAPLDGGTLRTAGWMDPGGLITLLAESGFGGISSYAGSLDGGFMGGDFADFGARPDDVRVAGVLGRTVPESYALLLRGGYLELTHMTSFFYQSIPLQPPANVTEFDVASDDSMLWVALVQADQLEVYAVYSGSVRVMPGPTRGGMSSTSLNVDTSCVAQSPAIARLEDHVVVAWTERCGTGPYKTYLRYLR